MASKRKRKKASKRTSLIRQQYMKERRRVSSMVTRLRRKGYDVSLSDIVGDIPKRVTKKRLEEIQSITSSKVALSSYKETHKAEPPKIEEKVTIMTADDYAILLFREQFEHHQVEVQAAVSKWINYVIKNFGKRALSEALDDIAYEGISLSDYGGYVIPIEDLALYLQKISHFIVGDKKGDLFELVNEVERIGQEYGTVIQDYDVEAYGSWHNKKSRRRRIINQER